MKLKDLIALNEDKISKKSDQNKSNLQTDIHIKEKQKIKYYPISTRCDGHKIYLAAEDIKLDNNYNNNVNSNKKRKKTLIPQRCIEINLYNSEQEENKNRSKSVNSNKLTNTINLLKNSENIENTIIKNLMKNFSDIDIPNSYNENAINSSKINQSMELTKNILSTVKDEKINKRLLIVGDENFINSLKNQTRKTKLLNAIQKYKIFKNIGSRQTGMKPLHKNIKSKKQFKKKPNRDHTKIDISDNIHTEKI